MRIPIVNREITQKSTLFSVGIGLSGFVLTRWWGYGKAVQAVASLGPAAIATLWFSNSSVTRDPVTMKGRLKELHLKAVSREGTPLFQATTEGGTEQQSIYSELSDILDGPNHVVYEKADLKITTHLAAQILADCAIRTYQTDDLPRITVKLKRHGEKGSSNFVHVKYSKNRQDSVFPTAIQDAVSSLKDLSSACLQQREGWTQSEADSEDRIVPVVDLARFLAIARTSSNWDGWAQQKGRLDTLFSEAHLNQFLRGSVATSYVFRQDSKIHQLWNKGTSLADLPVVKLGDEKWEWCGNQAVYLHVNKAFQRPSWDYLQELPPLQIAEA